ncbi:MAG: rhomboid family intramembrane serine protease [Bacillota bacterium]
MNWLDKLERKYGHLAIRELMKYIVMFNGLTFAFMYFDTTGSIFRMLILDPALVMKGQIWRLITFVFIPPEASLLWIVFVLYFYYMVGSALEHEWGSFRFNIYYLLGMLGTIIGAFVAGGGTTGFYLNLSLFLAFARLYPDFQLLLFFILPVKVKYLAWLNWAFIGYTVITQPVIFKVAAIVSIINYFVFFGRDIFHGAKSNRRAYQNKRKFHAKIPKDHTIHRCTVCGITEKDDPKMEFRYCSKCDGDYEYCMDHLKDHAHISKIGEA